jgi:galactonate dehydratase
MTNTRRSFITKTAIAAAMAPFASLSKTYGQGLENAMERTSKASSPSDLKLLMLNAPTLAADYL